MEKSTETEEEVEGLPRGHVGVFVATLTPAQKRMWRPMRRLMKQAKQAADGRSRSSSSSPQEQLHDAINEVQGTVTAEKIERLIDNAVDRGDVQALRVLAQMAGIDLTDRPKQAVGEGAKVIVIRPHPMLLTEKEEASVQAQVASAAA